MPVHINVLVPDPVTGYPIDPQLRDLVYGSGGFLAPEGFPGGDVRPGRIGTSRPGPGGGGRGAAVLALLGVATMLEERVDQAYSDVLWWLKMQQWDIETPRCTLDVHCRKGDTSVARWSTNTSYGSCQFPAANSTGPLAASWLGNYSTLYGYGPGEPACGSVAPVWSPNARAVRKGSGTKPIIQPGYGVPLPHPDLYPDLDVQPAYQPMPNPNDQRYRLSPPLWPFQAPGDLVGPADLPDNPLTGPIDPFIDPDTIPDLWPGPGGQPFPVPPVVVTVSPDVSPSPGPVTSPGVQPRPGTGPRPVPPRPPAPPAGSKPPKRGEKEKKTRTRSKALMVAIFKALDRISEAAEVVDAVYQALPQSVRKRWDCDARSKRRGLLDNAGQYGIDNADCKAQAVWHNFHKVDAVQAVKNIVRNELQDQALGQIYRRLPKNVGHAVDKGMKTVDDGLAALFDAAGI